MIIGIGADLCNIERIAKTLARFGERFTQRVFTEVERRRSDRRASIAKSSEADTGSRKDFATRYNPRAASYAKRFAAKEACAKALGTGMRMGTAWREMGVVNLPSGKPTLHLTGKAAERLASLVPAGYRPVIHLTITDDMPFAQAFVVIEALPIIPEAI